jgi:hypothetical protein
MLLLSYSLYIFISFFISYPSLDLFFSLCLAVYLPLSLPFSPSLSLFTHIPSVSVSISLAPRYAIFSFRYYAAPTMHHAILMEAEQREASSKEEAQGQGGEAWTAR